MKIGILGTRGIPNRYGGFEQMTEYLSRGLTERGHEVYVYSPHHHFYKEKKWNSVNIIHRYDPQPFMGTAGQFIYDLNCINDARKRNFDILLHLGYTSDAVWYSRWPSTRNLVNMDGMEWKRSKYNSLTRKFLKWSESIAVKKANRLIADSEGIKQHLLANYQADSCFIPYAAEEFRNGDPGVLIPFRVKKGEYSLAVARMEPENNLAMIIEGHLENKHPLLIIGNTENRYGKYLQRKYRHPFIRFSVPVYEKPRINSLRLFSKIYFHGHSVGGTNPSLLEAMGCGCRIAAHDNIFNRAVLQSEGEYFSTSSDIAKILNSDPTPAKLEHDQEINRHKIQTAYSPENMVAAYEKLMLDCFSQEPVYEH
jgi:glycosyltransferase involved in cell wall biosynthesis